jgi:hypothetical protein
MKIEVDLTDKEIQLLRGCISDLGCKDRDCVGLQLKIANAVLDATDPKLFPYKSRFDIYDLQKKSASTSRSYNRANRQCGFGCDRSQNQVTI